MERFGDGHCDVVLYGDRCGYKIMGIQYCIPAGSFFHIGEEEGTKWVKKHM